MIRNFLGVALSTDHYKMLGIKSTVTHYGRMYNNLALFDYVNWSNIYLERNSVRHVQLNVSNILIMSMRGVSESAIVKQLICAMAH